ncbi:MAG: response regulator transcription factor [Terriglobales bacterium]
MTLIDCEVSPLAVNVYLLAENRLVREALVRVFQKRSALRVVGHCRSSESVTAEIVASQCDILLSDSLVSEQTTNLVEKLCEIDPQIKTVLFSMDEEPETFLQAVRSGISGYLLKDASAAEIITAVRAAAQGEAVCPPKLCMRLFRHTSQEYREGANFAERHPSSKFGLTYRQRQLVTLVARGLTNKEIASNLNLSEYTVKNHIHRIMRQVDVGSRHEAVDVIRASGFVPTA